MLEREEGLPSNKRVRVREREREKHKTFCNFVMPKKTANPRV